MDGKEATVSEYALIGVELVLFYVAVAGVMLFISVPHCNRCLRMATHSTSRGMLCRRHFRELLQGGNKQA